MDGGFRHTSNLAIPAGYTYFAQFVAHDLTRRLAPSLRLEALYGDGPKGSPELYDPSRPGFLREGRPLAPGGIPDVPRNEGGRAVLGDPRNDRTMLISQLHAVFIRWHNVTLAVAGNGAFGDVRRTLRRRYQRLVVEDLLPRLVAKAPIAEQIRAGPRFVPRDAVAAEFVLGAGQIGHAMVQPRYRLNTEFSEVVDYPAFHPRVFDDAGDVAPLRDLRGQPLDAKATVEWDNFFPIGNPVRVQASSRINAIVCRPLFRFPLYGARSDLERSIPYRTLRAGELAGLPSGQGLAISLGFEPLSESAVWGSLPFYGPAPLWFYLLREAEFQAEGMRFGEVGGALFADTVIAALARDAESYVFADEEDDPGTRAASVGDLVAAVMATQR